MRRQIINYLKKRPQISIFLGYETRSSCRGDRSQDLIRLLEHLALESLLQWPESGESCHHMGPPHLTPAQRRRPCWRQTGTSALSSEWRAGNKALCNWRGPTFASPEDSLGGFGSGGLANLTAMKPSFTHERPSQDGTAAPAQPSGTNVTHLSACVKRGPQRRPRLEPARSCGLVSHG